MLQLPKNGYIYVRIHESYHVYDACKLGKTTNIPDRDSQYATGEIKRGLFTLVYEVPFENMDKTERLLQNEFRKWHIEFNAGTEFYNKSILDLIEPTMDKLGLPYRKLSTQEINELIRCARISEITIDNQPPPLLISPYVRRPYQIDIISKSVNHFQTNDMGILVLTCGVGKTLIALWIAQELNCNTILIGVPNKLLLNQWDYEIKKIFNKIPTLLISGNTTIENIFTFLEKDKDKCIIITTYASAKKLYEVTNKFINVKFELKINDECHHLTTHNMELATEKKTYIHMLRIPCVKQLSLTATLKNLEIIGPPDNMVISNVTTGYFGEIIDKKCVLWAIHENIICDYVIQTIITNEEQLEQKLSRFEIIEENDKRLFLSAFATLKSIYDKKSHHLLIYSNERPNALKLIKYINMLMNDKYFDIPGLYYSEYHSQMNKNKQDNIITQFKQSRCGIITCVYCLGEGWDCPLLDGVVFAGNMTSNIRIVQSALRASRKDHTRPDKTTKIILPILNRDDWLENNGNPDLETVREVIYQMGLEDVTITQKIKVFRIDVEKQKPESIKKEEREMIDDDLGEYDDELTQKIKLKTIKRSAISTTYEKARKIIADKKIKSKEGYYELCERDIRLTKEPEIDFKGQFTNWIDYLSIERVYYDLETCTRRVCECLKLNPELKKQYLELSNVCNELCKIDPLFPPNGLWVEYYKVNTLENIIIMTPEKKKISIIWS